MHRPRTWNALWALLSTGAAAIALVSTAHAADQLITSGKLLMNEKARKVILISKDPDISVAGSDPVGGSDSSISINYGTFSSYKGMAFTMPATGWRANGAGTSFKYKNKLAPSGPGPVKIAKLKSGSLKVVVRGAPPIPVPNGPAEISIVLSLDGRLNTYCVTFDGVGDGNQFSSTSLFPAPGLCSIPITCCKFIQGPCVGDGMGEGDCPGFAFGSDKVCDATDQCVSATPLFGPCCQFANGTCQMNYPSSAQCLSAGGVSFRYNAICLPEGTCSRGP